MISPPLVSVIIPVHNAEKYLPAAIESALAQTWPHVEVIVVDDGSTDSSLSVAKRYESDRVTLMHQENSGASAARNKGLEMAGGAYIQFLDADDLLSEDKIECQVALLTANPGKLAVCSTIHFPDGEAHEQYVPSSYEEKFIYNTDNPVEFLIRLMGGYDFKASMVQPGAWLTPRDLIDQAGPWNEDLSLDDDGEFFARVILSSNGILKSPGKNYYRKHFQSSKNLSSKANREGQESLYNSILLKEENLYKKEKGENAQKAIYKQLVELQIRCYLTQPDLYKRISLHLNDFPKWKYVPVFGGKIINAVADFFGWRMAKRMQAALSNTKSSL